MKIHIYAIGKLKNGPEQELVERYWSRSKNLFAPLGVEGPIFVELLESQYKTAAERQKREAEQLMAKLPKNAVVILLDETGKNINSEKFAANILKWREDGIKDLVFIIGGADGHDQQFKKFADLLLSFGSLTMPHQLVRILLTEQLYRAATILNNHPYHRN